MTQTLTARNCGCVVCSSERLKSIENSALGCPEMFDDVALGDIIKTCAKALNLELSEEEARSVEYHIVRGAELDCV